MRPHGLSSAWLTRCPPYHWRPTSLHPAGPPPMEPHPAGSGKAGRDLTGSRLQPVPGNSTLNKDGWSLKNNQQELSGWCSAGCVGSHQTKFTSGLHLPHKTVQGKLPSPLKVNTNPKAIATTAGQQGSSPSPPPPLSPCSKRLPLPASHSPYFLLFHHGNLRSSVKSAPPLLSPFPPLLQGARSVLRPRSGVLDPVMQSRPLPPVPTSSGPSSRGAWSFQGGVMPPCCQLPEPAQALQVAVPPPPQAQAFVHFWP